MRIAILVEGTRGDVHPMLVLGTALEAAGHRVRLCAPPDFGSEAVAHGLEFVALGESVRAYMGDVAGALHHGGLRFLREMKRWGDRSLVSQAAVLPRATSDADFVIGAGSILFAASVAELHDVPFRYVAYTPALLPSREHTPAVFPFQLRAHWANRLLWRAAGTLMNGMALRTVNRQRAALGMMPVRDLLSHTVSDRPIVAVDRALAAMPADCPVGYDQIRCLHPFEPEPLPAALEQFLAAGAPPVFLGFGSMPDPAPDATTRRVLDAIARLGCRALISRGWAGLGDGPLPAGVMAIDPVPHASLFPRLAAVVHHGGAGTTHTAARAGVPQVIVPHVLDQFYFARRVSSLGVGPSPIPRARLDATRLATTLGDVLGSRAFAACARDLARRLGDLGPTRPEASVILGAPRRRSPSLAA
jgi:UDP:flavonoid glycosyltransferase YjiC (YdhE family)